MSYFVFCQCLLDIPNSECSQKYGETSAESYLNTLNILGVLSLKDYHELLCGKLFQSVVSDANNRI